MMRACLTLLATAGMATTVLGQENAAVTEPAAKESTRSTSISSQSAGPRIEVVFVLDTTGSMSGLIEGAKQKIWSIANAMASASMSGATTHVIRSTCAAWKRGHSAWPTWAKRG